MLSLITSYLIQTNECALAHIGLFSVVYKNAQADVVNKQLIPPSEIIDFKEENNPSSPGLIHFIANKKDTSESETESQLNDFFKNWRKKIEAGETLCFDNFGCLKTNDEGKIIFLQHNTQPYFKSIPAAIVSHENVQPNTWSETTETTPVITNKYYTEEIESTRSLWHVWAIIFAAIGLSIIFYTFYNNKFSTSSIGNQSHFTIDTAAETHFNPSK